MKNSWCPICTGTCNIGEEITRIIFEEIFNSKFDKTKAIIGLISPVTGHPLEIDGFNDKLKIGFEYQGKQHFEFIPFLHPRIEIFHLQQQYDKIKKEFFLKNNWLLLEINELSSFNVDDAINHIVVVLKPLMKININKKSIYKRVRSLFTFGKYYTEVAKICKSKRLSLVSGTYYYLDDYVHLKHLDTLVEKKIKIRKILNDIKFIDKFKEIDANLIKNKKVYKKVPIEERINTSWNLELATEAANKCQCSKELYLYYPGAASWMVRNGFFEELTKHYCKNANWKKWTYEEIHELAKQYDRRREFCKYHRSAYEFARKNKILDDVCAHMPFNASGNPVN